MINNEETTELQPTSFDMFAHEIDGEFEHVFGSETQVRLCGNYPVVPVKVTFDDNGTHWGWFAFNRNKVSMIFRHFHLLNICFPCGVEFEENLGKGLRKCLKVVKREL